MTKTLLCVGALLCAASSLLLAQPSTDSGEFSAQSLDRPPRIEEAVEPFYPYDMRVAGLEGTVVVEFVVAKDGRVHDPVVVRSNNPWFERPALEAIQQWRYSPGTKDGRPVNTRVQQSVVFNLEGGGRDLWEVKGGKENEGLPPEFRWKMAPRATNSMFPAYPLADLQANRSGKVTFRFIVDPRGRVVRSMIESATTPEMGAAALAAIDAWDFSPARKEDGSACFAALRMEFVFHPNRGDAPVTDSARRILRELRGGGKRIHELSALDAPPQPISRRAPVYPSSLEQAGLAGEAVIEFFIDEKGDAQLPRVISATSPEFGYAAAQAVGTWRFAPPKKDAKTVVARAQIPVSFALKADPK
jgi:TonB family protein